MQVVAVLGTTARDPFVLRTAVVVFVCCFIVIPLVLQRPGAPLQDDLVAVRAPDVVVRRRCRER